MSNRFAVGFPSVGCHVEVVMQKPDEQMTEVGFNVFHDVGLHSFAGGSFSTPRRNCRTASKRTSCTATLADVKGAPLLDTERNASAKE